MPRQTLKQRPDGRYACKYKGKFFYGATQSEAFAAREEYKRMEQKGLCAQSAQTICVVYSARWVSTHKAHLTPAPYNAHVRVLDRFNAMYGDMRMQDITATDIQAFFNTFAAKSQSSINDARDTIKGLFKSAFADRVITHNPCDSVTIPKGTKGTHRAITNDERLLIHDTPHERMRVAAMAMLYSGIRRGEALALDIDRDINFFDKTITIRQAVRFDEKGLPHLVNPKSEAGIRTIPLLDVLANELCGKHGLLLQGLSGGLMSQSSFDRTWESYMTALETQLNGCSKRWYGKTKAHKQIIEKNPESFPKWKPVKIRPHDLRHSYCTMLYNSGVDLKTAMKWMGHADQTMTMRIYTHLTEEREKKSVAALAKGVNEMISSQNGSQSNGESA